MSIVVYKEKPAIMNVPGNCDGICTYCQTNDHLNGYDIEPGVRPEVYCEKRMIPTA